MEAAQLSINRWMGKTTMDTHTMEYYLARKKKKILSFATEWVDLENIMLSEISQSGKDKYDFTHMWNLMNKLS